MTFLEAIILGLIQGATEFLPISSSGHLILLPHLFGMARPDLETLSIAHLGTLLAVLIYFRRDIAAITRGVLHGLRTGAPLGTAEARLGWWIALGSIPAGVAGLLLADVFDQVFSDPATAAFFLLGTAGLLLLGERLLSGHKDVAEMSALDALVIGLFQMVALLPGISRSGSTIAGGLLRGLDRPAAARFGFLLGIPAILAAGGLAVGDLLSAGVGNDTWLLLLATFLAAAVSGYACIYFLLAWVRQRSLYIFVVYCALFGGAFLLLNALGVV